MSLTAMAVSFIALLALCWTSGVVPEARETIRLHGIFKFTLIILASIATVAIFIGAMWLLSALGFY